MLSHRVVAPLLPCLLAACLEPTLTKTDDPPVAVIQSPGDDATFDAGEPVELVGRIADDGPVEEVSVTWLDNGSTVLAEGVFPDAEGFVYFTTADLIPGEHAITLRATDPGNQVHEDSIALEVLYVADNPTIQIVRPATTDVGEQGTEFVFEALVADIQDDPRDMTVELGSDQDGYMCAMPPDSAGIALCRAAPITAGEHRLTFRVTDTEGYTGEATTLFEVAPVPEFPVITVIDPTPGAAVLQSSPLAFTAEVSDRQDAPQAMVAQVSSDIEGTLCVMTIDPTGVATCWGSLQTMELHILTFTVTDTDLNETSTNVLVQVTDSSGIDDDGDGFAETGGDCDDSDATVYPGAPELPDGQDNDCNGYADEGTILADDDGDGFCESQSLPCTDGAARGDCDDTEYGVNPDADEWCDGIDNNCVLGIDEDGAEDCVIYYVDADRDGFGAQGSDPVCTCAASTPFDALNDDDCDDAQSDVAPGQAEILDGLDNNCNGVVDEGTSAWDDDGDGYCESTTVPCADGSQLGDCNDAVYTINPGVPEVCNDGLDNNCNTVQDEPGAQGCQTFFLDSDGDGYGDPNASVCECAQGANSVINDDDCNDANGSIFPGGTELPNGLDDDCDQAIDEGTVLWDDDGDGYCESTSVPCADGTQLGDCNDSNIFVNPLAAEVCNDGVDNNCDNTQDEAGAQGCTVYYVDSDGDGYGDPASSQCLCSSPPGGVLNDDDCNDNASNVRPGASETASNSLIGIDDNCDGRIDEGTRRYDNDGDGYCEAATCSIQPDGTTWQGNDCNDFSAAINPGATEVCGGTVDEDCTGFYDDGIDVINCTTYYQDWDGDGYGAPGGLCTCSAGGTYTVTNDNDCYDFNEYAYPGEPWYWEFDRGDGSFDWNCDGVQRKEFGDSEAHVARCEGSIDLGFFIINCESNPGWSDDIPGCGEWGTWVDYCYYSDPISSALSCLDASIWDGFVPNWAQNTYQQYCR